MKNNVKKIDYIFIRHGKLNLPFADHAHMPSKVLHLLGRKILNPPIDQEYITHKLIPNLFSTVDAVRISRIITSPSLRCVQTGLAIQKHIQKLFGRSIVCSQDQDLLEVDFNLDLIREGSSDFTNVEDLNTAVLKSMLTGSNAENVTSVMKRVERFFDHINTSEGQTLIVSHDFIMRVIEIYVRQSMVNIHQTKRNGYGEGFAVDRDCNNFFPISYF